MSFYVRHRHGGNDRDPPLRSLPALLSELDEDPSDIEHVSVSVVHDSNWALASYGGRLTLEHLEELDIEPRHLRADKATQLRLFAALADGRLDEVFAEPWHPGYE